MRNHLAWLRVVSIGDVTRAVHRRQSALMQYYRPIYHHSFNHF